MNILDFFSLVVWFLSKSTKAVRIENEHQLNYVLENSFTLFEDLIMPPNDINELQRIMTLPENVNKIILGADDIFLIEQDFRRHVEYLPEETREHLFNLYECTTNKNVRKFLRTAEQAIVSVILSSVPLNIEDLNELLISKISMCAAIRRSRRSSGDTSIGILGTPAIECQEILYPRLDPRTMDNINNFQQVYHYMRYLPFPVCARIIMIGNIADSFQSQFYKKLQDRLLEQTTEVIHAYLSTDYSKKKRDKFIAVLGTMFYRLFHWYKKMVFDIDALRNNEDMHYIYPHYNNLPTFEMIYPHTDEEGRPIKFSGKKFQENKWIMLTKILNLPACTSPVIIGNIHMIPLSDLDVILSAIDFYRRKAFPVFQLRKLQNRIIYLILKMKYNLYNNLVTAQDVLVFDRNTDARKTNDDLVPIYDKISMSPLIMCLNVAPDTDEKKEGTFDISNYAENYNQALVESEITKFTAPNCIWASIVKLIIHNSPAGSIRQMFERNLFKVCVEYIEGYSTPEKSLEDIIHLFRKITSTYEISFKIGHRPKPQPAQIPDRMEIGQPSMSSDKGKDIASSSRQTIDVESSDEPNPSPEMEADYALAGHQSEEPNPPSGTGADEYNPAVGTDSMNMAQMAGSLDYYTHMPQNYAYPPPQGSGYGLPSYEDFSAQFGDQGTQYGVYGTQSGNYGTQPGEYGLYGAPPYSGTQSGGYGPSSYQGSDTQSVGHATPPYSDSVSNPANYGPPYGDYGTDDPHRRNFDE